MIQMNRRKPLESLVGSGAVGLGGLLYRRCRSFDHISTEAAAGLNAQDVSALFTVNPLFTTDVQNHAFPQIVASGDPSANGVVLWIHVDRTFQNASDQLCRQIASPPDFSTVLVQGVTTLSADADDTAKLPITVPGVLAPYTVTTTV
jgi:phosphodiesterase/alkaline phosphatase D-like protein